MPEVKYIAQLKGVRELALHGAADLAFWEERLAGEGLVPVAADGAAQVVVTGLDGRWLAWPFRDLSVSVLARRTDADEVGVYFAGAFNASRFLVFFESRWFGLPYARRAVHVELGAGGAMRLGDGDLAAEMAPRAASGAPEEMGYTGALFLPGGRWLHVDIRGGTFVHAFDAARDRFALGGTDDVLVALRASGFRPLAWHVRPDATHARSKTFRR